MTAIHGELTADGNQIVLVSAGTDWEVERTAGVLLRLTALVKRSDPPGALVLPASWQAVVQLSHSLNGTWRPGPRLTAWTANQVRLRTAPGTGLAVTLPEGCVPREYQAEAARMIAATGRVLLFDDPGTGKTISAIVGLLERALANVVLPVVVVCPASVADPWVDAWRTWAPHWTAIAWRGSPKQRKSLAGTADVYVTSYDTARVDAADASGQLMRLGANTVIADECHFLKSPQAARSKAVRRLARGASSVVALSGTPITHHPGDLWPALEAVVPVAWPSRERWTRRYCVTRPGDYSEQVLGLNEVTEAELRTALLGQHRRVAKADVLPQLPPKVYSVRTVELPPAWRKAYDQMEEQMLAELPGGGALEVMSVLAQLTRLSQMASAAADVEVTAEVADDGTEREHVRVRLKAPSWKADALLEVLAERPGEPVVTFAPSRQLIMLAGAAAESAGYRTGYVAGGQSMTERTKVIASLQAGELDVLCATTGAGGVGLTFTAAATAVFLQRPWSLVEALQSEDRLHRIGAEHHDCVEIIDVVAKDTIDSRVRAVLRSKAGQLADLVQDPRIVTEPARR